MINVLIVPVMECRHIGGDVLNHLLKRCGFITHQGHKLKIELYGNINNTKSN